MKPILANFKNVVAIGVVCALFTTSCNNGPQDVLPVEAQITQYFQSKITANGTFNKGYSAYFDFSDGMPDAYRNDKTRDNLKSITQKVTGNGWDVYGLGDWVIDTLRMSQTELYAKIIQSKYSAMRAPIEKALNAIIEGNKLSLLVTDFEEYGQNKKLKYQAFATKYLKTWLMRGGCVNFFISHYFEGKQPKHLYYIVFDNAQQELTNIIRDALAGRDNTNDFFCLTANPTCVATQYATSNIGGNYHNALGEDLVTAVNETDPRLEKYSNLKGIPAEFYPCGDSWGNIRENAKAMSELEGNDKYYALLRNLFVDCSNKDSYDVKSFNLKVTNVQKDFELYTVSQAALRNPVDSTRLDDGSFVIGYESHPDAKFYYNLETGKILDEFVYKTQPITEIYDMFMLRKDVMQESASRNNMQQEIVIDFSDNFHAVNSSISEGDLLRLDVLVDECSIDYDNIARLFSWGPDNHNVINRNLEEAIRNVLQDSEVMPRGKVIYSYFIKAY